MLRTLVVVGLLLLVSFQTFAQDVPAPTATPESFTYVVQLNDTLGAIAFRNRTSVGAIMRLNNLQSSEMIIVGQPLLIPVRSTPTPAPAPTEMAISVLPVDNPPAEADLSMFDYGIEADFDGQDVSSIVAQINGLGMHWAKLRLSWRALQPNAGSIDYTQLDAIIDGLNAGDLNVLLTITNAPDWARSSALENGPPDDFGTYAAFVSEIAARYVGRVKAYEIWHEPNLRREWNSGAHPVSADSYADLLRGAYAAIKASDPGATVVSAGLAPTGFNDGINALDDRLYLARLYQVGLTQISDAVGAHPFGFANPADILCCQAAPGVTTHFEHPSFYFLNTLNDYRAIMVANGDINRKIWVTEFGWGTSEDTSAPPENSSFVSANTLEEQASYLTRAFELGAGSGFVGMMIAYNLNSCTAQPTNTEACYYSLTAPNGTPRPAYNTLSMIFAPAIAG
ncbi:MAG: LysM peptidoglycan-binding domain-containing protein [Chloroflexota bacterium]